MSVARALRLCPGAIVVEPRMAAYSEASKDVYRVFEDTSPRVEGLSIDEAFLDVRGVRRLTGHARGGRRAAAARGARAGRAADHSRCREDEVPRQGGERSGQAGRPARRTARAGARVPAPAPGRAPLGRRPGDGETAARGGDHDRRPGRRARGGRARLAARAEPRDGSSTRSPTTAIRGRCSPPPRGSIGAQRALGPFADLARRRSTRRSPGWSTASRGGCESPAEPAGRSCFGCASTTSRARPARTRCRTRPPARERSSRPPAACSRSPRR